MRKCISFVEFFCSHRGVTLDQMIEIGPRGGRYVYYRARCLKSNQIALWHHSRSSAASAAWPDKQYRLVMESDDRYQNNITVYDFTAASDNDAIMLAESKHLPPVVTWYLLDDQGKRI